MPRLLASGLFLRHFIDKISTKIASLRIYVVRTACLKRLTPFLTKSDYRIIRPLAQIISKLSAQATQTGASLYKSSLAITITVSFLLTTDEHTTSLGLEKTLRSMCFISLARIYVVRTACLKRLTPFLSRRIDSNDLARTVKTNVKHQMSNIKRQMSNVKTNASDRTDLSRLIRPNECSSYPIM